MVKKRSATRRRREQGEPRAPQVGTKQSAADFRTAVEKTDVVTVDQPDYPVTDQQMVNAEVQVEVEVTTQGKQKSHSRQGVQTASCQHRGGRAPQDIVTQQLKASQKVSDWTKQQEREKTLADFIWNIDRETVERNMAMFATVDGFRAHLDDAVGAAMEAFSNAMLEEEAVEAARATEATRETSNAVSYTHQTQPTRHLV